MVVLHFNLFKSKQIFFLERADLFGLWGTSAATEHIFIRCFLAMVAKTARKIWHNTWHLTMILCGKIFLFFVFNLSVQLFPPTCMQTHITPLFNVMWEMSLYACLSLRRSSKINSNPQITKCLAALVLLLLEIKSLVSVFFWLAKIIVIL